MPGPVAMFALGTEKMHRNFWNLSIVIMVLITATDAFLGRRVILIGLLMVGPCCALLSARRASTAQAGIAVGLALLIALRDGKWATTARFAFAGAVLLVAVACTWVAGIVESVIGKLASATTSRGRLPESRFRPGDLGYPRAANDPRARILVTTQSAPRSHGDTE